MLVLLTGLPCTGKSSIAAAVGDELSAPIYSVDPLEAVLLRAGVDRQHRSDYVAYDLAAELAEDQLRRGLPVWSTRSTRWSISGRGSWASRTATTSPQR